MPAVLRLSAVAGSWYPGTAVAIAEEVDGYLGATGPVSVPGRLVALVSPHAGLRYSGPVAAHGYALLRAPAAEAGRGAAEAVVVLVGPSHRAAFDGVALQARGAWETPLGRAPIDEDLSQALLDADPVVFEDPDVPRRALAGDADVPAAPAPGASADARGTQSRTRSSPRRPGKGSGRAVLLVASSDLSHHQYTVANRVDGGGRSGGRFDEAALMARLETHHNVTGGGGPVVAARRPRAPWRRSRPS
jgi:predicted class III extradiol MEMO1 family dioxygenase